MVTEFSLLSETRLFGRGPPTKGLNRLSRIPIVAIVDDDEAIRDALSELLMLEGFDCHPFEQASCFLDEVAEGTFDCLLTDMRMPCMSGLELLEHLHDRGLDLPTIVLTSVVDERILPGE